MAHTSTGIAHTECPWPQKRSARTGRMPVADARCIGRSNRENGHLVSDEHPSPLRAGTSMLTLCALGVRDAITGKPSTPWPMRGEAKHEVGEDIPIDTEQRQ